MVAENAMNFLSYFILFLSLVNIVIWVAWAILNKRRWLYAIAPITLFLNSAIMYIFNYLHLLPPPAINTWSNIVRIHSFLTIGLGGIMMIIARRYSKWTRK